MKVKELLETLQKANPEATIEVVYDIPKEDSRTGRPKTLIKKNIEFANIINKITFPGEDFDQIVSIKIEDD